mmetsp:Transcript_20574/g.29475  ORF Transcript_20574/g.29475 Transcript_20574/m.29475 type:complete len:739 (-) Transcript_20574:1119-3335(-)
MSRRAFHCANLASDMNTKEILFHISIILWPQNSNSIKSLGYALECFGHTSAARSAYLQCFLLTSDYGCWIHFLLASPTLSKSDSLSKKAFRKSLSGFHQLLQMNSNTCGDIAQMICGQQIVDMVYSNAESNRRTAVSDDIRSKSSIIDLKTLTALPLNPQYLGQPPAIIYSLLSTALTSHFPSLTFPAIQSLHYIQARREIFSGGENVIRLGIVSESHGNTSPGVCVQQILESLSVYDKSCRFHIIFFDRPNLNTVFAESLRMISSTHIVLDPNNLDISKSLIANAAVDILLYLSLSTEKFSFLLGHARLAPVQIQYGIGHPFSSGLKSIDFSVVSELMLSRHVVHIDASHCARLAFECDQHLLKSSVLSDHHDENNLERAEQEQSNRSDSICSEYSACVRFPSYTEQVIQFQSLAYFLLDPVDMYSADADAVRALRMFAANRIPFAGSPLVTSDFSISTESPLPALTLQSETFVDEEKPSQLFYRLQPFTFHSSSIQRMQAAELLSCSELDGKLQQWGIAGEISARQIGCYNLVTFSPNSTFEVVVREVTLYSCLQSVKKFHPSFDEVLRGILSQDSTARLLVLDSFRAVLPRLSLSPSLERRLLFLPRMPHVEYLGVLSLSALFLNPFPFGGGVTSSEALALCVPVLTLPAKSAVLDFASAQLSQFGEDVKQWLTVHSVAEYVRRAVSVAHSEVVSLHRLKDVICGRKHAALFGQEVLSRSVEEWAQLLGNLRHSI